MYKANAQSHRLSDFDEFFLHNYVPIVQTLTLTTGDPQIAAESTQDAFCRAYGRWTKVRRLDRPEAWIRRVALNRARDLLRTDSRRSNTEARALSGEGADPSRTLTQTTDDSIVGVDMARLLSHLSPKQRTALVLHYLDDRPVDEIAEIMSISTGTVKVHLHRGRRSLRALVEQTESVGTP